MNSWYAAGWSTEITGSLLRRTLFGEDVVLFRTEDGTPAVLLDRCPHKGMPLSLGERKGDVVVCPYHGLEFDRRGQCTRIPGQDRIPPDAKVRSFPCIERYGLVWFWPGAAESADERTLFQFRNHGAPGWECAQGPYTLFPASLENILDNLVDPAHTTFVHKKTIGGADAAEVPLTVQQDGDNMVVGRWIENSEPVPVMKRYGNFAGRVDRWQQYHLYLPNISLVDMGAVETSAPRDEAARDSRYRTLSYAVLTPETAQTTHYFWFVLRTFALGNAAVTADLLHAYVETFDEDRVLLGALQRRGGDMYAGSLRLAIDNASIRMRRTLERMGREEASHLGTS